MPLKISKKYVLTRHANRAANAAIKAPQGSLWRESCWNAVDCAEFYEDRYKRYWWGESGPATQQDST